MNAPTESRAAELEAALRDIKMGAQIMLQIRSGDALERYAQEVERVAKAALEGEPG